MDEKSKKIIKTVAVGVGGVIGAGIGFAVAQRMSPKRLGLFLGGGTAGLVCGLVPYFIGKKKNNRKLGKIALWSCIAAGLILGILLALPVAVIFSIVIAVKPAQSSSTDEIPEEPNKTELNK